MTGKRKIEKIRHDIIRKQTKAQDIKVKIKRLKWRWAGHTARGVEKWSKDMICWYPREGKRCRGRQKKRWEDDIVEVAGRTWTRTAQNREEWKRLGEAFVAGQTDEEYDK